MRVIAVVSRKGGVGKSTVSINLCAAAARHRQRALLVDVDPQPSAAGWLEDRQDSTSVLFTDVAVVTATAKELPQVIKEARAQFAFVVIDTPPFSGTEAGAAAALATFVLIPLRPSKFDLRSIASTLRIAQLSGVAHAVLLNGVPARGTVADEAEADLKDRVTVCPVRLSARVAYAYSAFDGRSVFEYEPAGQAAAEVERLYQWIIKQQS